MYFFIGPIPLEQTALKYIPAQFVLYLIPVILFVVFGRRLFPQLSLFIRRKKNGKFLEDYSFSKDELSLLQKPSVKAENLHPAKSFFVPAIVPHITAIAAGTSLALCMTGIILNTLLSGTRVSQDIFLIATAVLFIFTVALEVIYLINTGFIHSALKKMTGGKYRIGPAAAIAFHFIPIFSFAWTLICAFAANSFLNKYRKAPSPVPILAFLLGASIAGLLLTGITLSVPAIAVTIILYEIVRISLSYKIQEEVKLLCEDTAGT
ncbi:MAG: hypothetical protein EHM28_11180 [Spirochaetaceae bacterium]|nr:MAG: hypothetical protein EHM28_11180 [Spirochaetaceae bacterium]